uniref:Uncharacterized protein n=1 Tax=Rhizophora mucronata TaxID=61149 RepID=A0A2P2Q4B3_RHIMU
MTLISNSFQYTCLQSKGTPCNIPLSYACTKVIPTNIGAISNIKQVCTKIS